MAEGDLRVGEEVLQVGGAEGPRGEADGGPEQEEEQPPGAVGRGEVEGRVGRLPAEGPG